MKQSALYRANSFIFTGNIFISFSADVEECQHSGDEGFEENDTPGPRKRTPIYKIGKEKHCFFFFFFNTSFAETMEETCLEEKPSEKISNLGEGFKSNEKPD